MPGQKAVGYVRVSLEDEHPENQVIAIQEYCQRNNIELISIFQDVGVSGAHPALKRPGFKQMLSFCTVNDIRTIIMLDLTRLGRDLFDTIETMKFLLENNFNIIFVKNPEISFVGEDNEINRAVKKAILALLSAFAEVERAYIRERTKLGLQRARREGKHIGRKSKMHDPRMQELFKIIVCKEKKPYREAAQLLGLSKAQVEYWAKKLCNF